MLQLQAISKQYQTGDFVQQALREVSLSFRDSEFVAILGPSGSGKTTLLNIIGGLDRYDSGDLIINGVSTRQYRDRDWDSYRNHTIGFVFQSYNLIPHQSVLANVELALTISGVGRAERRRRAMAALEEVGLADHLHKRPNQLSGGQMQRVAIARALVNSPDILLADEPTGALDSDTSVQVMELLKQVAQKRLVIMVTHNPELAERYATRTVRLRDGAIQGDTDPYTPPAAQAVHRNLGHASMSVRTALALSFNNLRTKKGRTLLTAFAGSIGIIGIALILALSSGVNTYITDIQRDTMTSYPVTIDAKTIDLSSIMGDQSQMGRADEAPSHPLDGVYSDSTQLEMASQLTTSLTENNLTKFKAYLDDPDSEIQQYLGENGVVYTYAPKFSVYARTADGTLLDTASTSYAQNGLQAEGAAGQVQSSMMSLMQSSSGGRMSDEIFCQLLPGRDGALVSAVNTDSYELLSGSWPQSSHEVVLVLNARNELPTSALYALGLVPEDDYQAMLDAIEQGEPLEAQQYSWRYDELLQQHFYLVSACDTYDRQEDGTFRPHGTDQAALEALMDRAVELTVCGVIRPTDDAANANLTGAVAYTAALTDELIAHAAESEIVRAQQESPEENVLTGLRFAPADDAQRAEDARTYLAGLGVTEKAEVFRQLAAALYAQQPQALQALQTMDETQLAAQLDEYLQNPQQEVLLQIYDSSISPGSYSDNLEAFGFVSYDAPASISLYADTFEDKDAIADCITRYNQSAAESDQITYTDFVAMMTSSITTIINVISYVLIAFVAVSLVVSSIMIGIITFISVMERTKEIGILRALGASRRNISQVFNAETFIIGLCAGALGVGISALLTLPINAVIHRLIDNDMVNARLPLPGAIILIVLSVLLTLLGGLIPAKKAAKKDPVTALRTE